MTFIFLRWLPQRRGDEPVAVHVRPISAEIADWWHDNVQPAINEVPGRADAGWSWPLFTAWNGWTEPPALLPQGFAVCLEPGDQGTDEHATQPIALVQVVARFPFVLNRQQHAVLLHYFSTIPRELLGQKSPRLVGQASVDIAVVRALQEAGGRMVAPVNTRFAARLIEWYLGECGLIRSPTEQPCCHHDPASAETGYNRMIRFRLQHSSREEHAQ